MYQHVSGINQVRPGYVHAN